MGSLMYIKIKQLHAYKSTRTTSLFIDPNIVRQLSFLHDEYVFVPADRAPNNIVCLCKSHKQLDKWIRYWHFIFKIQFAQHLQRRISRIIIGLFHVPLEFQPKIKNWIFRHCIRHQNYTSIQTCNIILLDLPIV